MPVTVGKSIVAITVILAPMRNRILPVFMIFALSACAAEPQVELGGERFSVEIADSDETRARGLMFRDSLAADRGMLFVFGREAMRAFWMKNTRIPLDILYFDADLELVSMQQSVPPCGAAPRCPSYPSAAPAQYVLELRAGTARRLGVKTGDRLQVFGVPAVESGSS